LEPGTGSHTDETNPTGTPQTHAPRIQATPVTEQAISVVHTNTSFLGSEDEKEANNFAASVMGLYINHRNRASTKDAEQTLFNQLEIQYVGAAMTVWEQKLAELVLDGKAAMLTEEARGWANMISWKRWHLAQYGTTTSSDNTRHNELQARMRAFPSDLTYIGHDGEHALTKWLTKMKKAIREDVTNRTIKTFILYSSIAEDV